MIARATQRETLFRHTAKGREPLAAPGEGGEHVHYTPSKQIGIGCITSKRAGGCTFWELLAFKLGCNIATARRLYEEGLIH